ncbi:MAG: M15 family metallopeptidase [Alkalibacterium sp.]|uniref:M15 family metallopeptidase n=1 Tax=Alkalibacterium sp. TaxID=1872447 RepID=UPI003970943F
MTFKKRMMMTTLASSILLLNACGQTSEEEPSPDETAQEEVNQNEESQTTEEPDDDDRTEVDEDLNGSSTSGNEDDEQSDSVDKEMPQLDLEGDILEPASFSVLVNKQYSLPEDYVPENLVTVEVPTVLPNPEIKQMRQVAADALKEMFDAAETSGIILHARSGYRSYQTQVQLFNNYVNSHGEEAANKYSARPGESEHQTGLVMDVTSESVGLQLTEEFGNTEEGTWVSNNAHEFGFIIRYLEGKEDITGYVYEPWHIRYLGPELATDVFESGLSYEEYLIDRGINIEIQ